MARAVIPLSDLAAGWSAFGITASEALIAESDAVSMVSPFDPAAITARWRALEARVRGKLAAINALYQLVQRDALTMSKLGGDKLVEELFGMLDKDASIGGVRNVISSWLQQTVVL